MGGVGKHFCMPILLPSIMDPGKLSGCFLEGVRMCAICTFIAISLKILAILQSKLFNSWVTLTMLDGMVNEPYTLGRGPWDFQVLSFEWTLMAMSSCRAPLHKECLKHHGHKGDPGVTPGTCGAVGERAQVILMWVRAPGVGNASHPRRLGGTRAMPYAMRSLWRVDSRMLKNTSIRGVS